MTTVEKIKMSNLDVPNTANRPTGYTVATCIP